MFQPLTLPPLSAEFENSVDPGGQAAATTQKWKMARGSSGQSAIDYGNTTVITDPNAQQAITLDHVKKEALVVPLPPAPGGLGGMIPGARQAPSPHAPSRSDPPVDVKDLGKKLIAGHEAEGKLFTFQPPQPPQLPTPPAANLPQTPQPSGGKPLQAGSVPAAPKIQPPQLLRTVEVWTSPKLQLPLLTKAGSGASQQTTTCKQVTTGEPPSSAFQIPPGYKVVHPPSITPLPRA
jgi:hypothetical protein